MHTHIYSTCSGNASITDNQNQLFWVKSSRAPDRGDLDPKDTWLLTRGWKNFWKSSLKALVLPAWDFTVCTALGPELLLEYNLPELDRILYFSFPGGVLELFLVSVLLIETLILIWREEGFGHIQSKLSSFLNNVEAAGEFPFKKKIIQVIFCAYSVCWKGWGSLSYYLFVM